jgi:hypothetical protein
MHIAPRYVIEVFVFLEKEKKKESNNQHTISHSKAFDVIAQFTTTP